MATFNFHLHGSAEPCRVQTDASTVYELGEHFARYRFVTGWLLAEGDRAVEPPVEILVPFQRIHLIASEG